MLIVSKPCLSEIGYHLLTSNITSGWSVLAEPYEVMTTRILELPGGLVWRDEGVIILHHSVPWWITGDYPGW